MCCQTLYAFVITLSARCAEDVISRGARFITRSIGVVCPRLDPMFPEPRTFESTSRASLIRFFTAISSSRMAMPPVQLFCDLQAAQPLVGQEVIVFPKTATITLDDRMSLF